ncbi:hypothetical protein F2Q68_00010219 [Brassica cretica]|uniref:Uncharacterized protein n=1 Tax=Brassica cretica TaxID=69181 RepID=A0A8S9L4T2_BRACR|nr:hypothetical protein F2Q68_00010219 [Brassica cretica]
MDTAQGSVLVYQLDQTEVFMSDHASPTVRVIPSDHSVHADHNFPLDRADQTIRTDPSNHPDLKRLFLVGPVCHIRQQIEFCFLVGSVSHIRRQSSTLVVSLGHPQPFVSPFIPSVLLPQGSSPYLSLPVECSFLRVHQVVMMFGLQRKSSKQNSQPPFKYSSNNFDEFVSVQERLDIRCKDHIKTTKDVADPKRRLLQFDVKEISDNFEKGMMKALKEISKSHKKRQPHVHLFFTHLEEEPLDLPHQGPRLDTRISFDEDLDPIFDEEDEPGPVFDEEATNITYIAMESHLCFDPDTTPAPLSSELQEHCEQSDLLNSHADMFVKISFLDVIRFGLEKFLKHSKGFDYFDRSLELELQQTDFCATKSFDSFAFKGIGFDLSSSGHALITDDLFPSSYVEQDMHVLKMNIIIAYLDKILVCNVYFDVHLDKRKCVLLVLEKDILIFDLNKYLSCTFDPGLLVFVLSIQERKVQPLRNESIDCGQQPEIWRSFVVQTGYRGDASDRGSAQKGYLNIKKVFCHESNFPEKPTDQRFTEAWNHLQIFKEEAVMNFPNRRFSSLFIREYQTFKGDSGPKKKRPEPKPILHEPKMFPQLNSCPNQKHWYKGSVSDGSKQRTTTQHLCSWNMELEILEENKFKTPRKISFDEDLDPIFDEEDEPGPVFDEEATNITSIAMESHLCFDPDTTPAPLSSELQEHCEQSDLLNSHADMFVKISFLDVIRFGLEKFLKHSKGFDYFDRSLELELQQTDFCATKSFDSFAFKGIGFDLSSSGHALITDDLFPSSCALDDFLIKKMQEQKSLETETDFCDLDCCDSVLQPDLLSSETDKILHFLRSILDNCVVLSLDDIVVYNTFFEIHLESLIVDSQSELKLVCSDVEQDMHVLKMNIIVAYLDKILVCNVYFDVHLDKLKCVLLVLGKDILIFDLNKYLSCTFDSGLLVFVLSIQERQVQPLRNESIDCAQQREIWRSFVVQTGYLGDASNRGSVEKGYLNIQKVFCHESNFPEKPTHQRFTEAWNPLQIFKEEAVMNFPNRRFSSLFIHEYQTSKGDSGPKKKRPEPKPILHEPKMFPQSTSCPNQKHWSKGSVSDGSKQRTTTQHLCSWNMELEILEENKFKTPRKKSFDSFVFKENGFDLSSSKNAMITDNLIASSCALDDFLIKKMLEQKSLETETDFCDLDFCDSVLQPDLLSSETDKTWHFLRSILDNCIVLSLDDIVVYNTFFEKHLESLIVDYQSELRLVCSDVEQDMHNLKMNTIVAYLDKILVCNVYFDVHLDKLKCVLLVLVQPLRNDIIDRAQQPEIWRSFVVQTGYLGDASDRGSAQNGYLNIQKLFCHESNFTGKPTNQGFTEA